jgi:hypothetical protein
MTEQPGLSLGSPGGVAWVQVACTWWQAVVGDCMDRTGCNQMSVARARIAGSAVSMAGLTSLGRALHLANC